MESPLSVVDDLRIVDVHVDPASPAPGEVPTMSPLVLDPTGEGFETYSWWCVGDVCGEGELPPAPFVQANVLVCAPGVCEGPTDLSDPEAWMAELPFEGVSLATRNVPMSGSPDVRLNDHPVWVTEPVLPSEVSPEEEVELVFAASDEQPLVGWLYATEGGVPTPSVDLVEGEGTLTWTAPSTGGTVDVVVVVEDGSGGTNSWRGTVAVR